MAARLETSKNTKSMLQYAGFIMCLGKVKVTFTTHTPTMVAAVIVPRPPWGTSGNSAAAVPRAERSRRDVPS